MIETDEVMMGFGASDFRVWLRSGWRDVDDFMQDVLDYHKHKITRLRVDMSKGVAPYNNFMDYNNTLQDIDEDLNYNFYLLFIRHNHSFICFALSPILPEA